TCIAIPFPESYAHPPASCTSVILSAFLIHVLPARSAGGRSVNTGTTAVGRFRPRLRPASSFLRGLPSRSGAQGPMRTGAAVRPTAGATPLPGGTLMIRWIKDAWHRRRTQKRLLPRTRKFTRTLLETLEDRLAPAAALASPSVLDPVAPATVD